MYNQEGVPFVALDEFGGSHGVMYGGWRLVGKASSESVGDW